MFDKLNKDYIFVSAAGSGDLITVRTSVKNGIDINKTKMQSATANYFAIAHQQTIVVNFLLENGADPNVGLNKAIRLRNFEIIQMLLVHGASVSKIIPGENKSALEIANETGNIRIIDLVHKYDKNSTLDSH